MIVLAPWLVRIITLGFARAITLFPFVFINLAEDKKDERLMNHEWIHLRQQIELFVIPFYVFYLGEYILRRASGKSHREAYRSISFEQEAFDYENQLDYLARRPVFAFTKYWKIGS